MSNTGLIPSLFGFTLIAVLLIAVIGFVYFLRKRSNRHPMGGARGDAIQADKDSAIRSARANPTVDPTTRDAGDQIRES